MLIIGHLEMMKFHGGVKNLQRFVCFLEGGYFCALEKNAIFGEQCPI